MIKLSAIDRIRRQAKKDAMRYTEAQLNYGKGAGTQRKILNAEIQERLKNDIYKTAFEAALAGINQANVAEKIRKKKGVQATFEGAKKAARSVRRAESFYYRNQYWLSAIFRAIFGE